MVAKGPLVRHARVEGVLIPPDLIWLRLLILPYMQMSPQS